MALPTTNQFKRRGTAGPSLYLGLLVLAVFELLGHGGSALYHGETRRQSARNNARKWFSLVSNWIYWLPDHTRDLSYLYYSRPKNQGNRVWDLT
jgi:hypothetical protein